MAIAKDLVSGILSGNIDTSATNIIVSIGEGLSSSQITGFFPPTPFHMTIMPKSPTIGVANSFDSEVVNVTAVAADQSGDASLTVVRGQYDTTAKSFDSGAIVTLGVYAEDAVFKSDDVLPPAEAWVGSDDIKANAVKASNIDFATLLDILHPVGSYYETSDTTFNPNTAWGGTWVEDTWGRVTVAYQSDQPLFDQVGEIGGELTHTHGPGNMGVCIETFCDNNIGRWYMDYASMRNDLPEYHQDNRVYTANSYKEPAFSETSTAGIPIAGNTSHSSSLQPYIVVKRWHRTA